MSLDNMIQSDFLKAALVDPLRSHLIVLRPRHEPFAQPLIHHENNLSSNLSAQEARFLRPDVFPLRKVIWHLQ